MHDLVSEDPGLSLDKADLSKLSPYLTEAGMFSIFSLRYSVPTFDWLVSSCFVYLEPIQGVRSALQHRDIFTSPPGCRQQ